MTDVITLMPAQMLPVPELSSTIGSDYLLVIDSLQSRMLVFLNIEKRMTSAEMGLLAQSFN